MNSRQMHSKAQELSASHSGYNLARRLLALEEELQEARREFGQSRKAQMEAPDPAGTTYLPEITPEIAEQLGGSDLIAWHDGWQWTQTAIDFACIIPVKPYPPAPAAVPEGWKLVPKVPTMRMLSAISGNKNKASVWDHKKYDDILSAAPSHPNIEA